MRSVRLVCISAILGSTMLVMQSDSVTHISQPLFSKDRATGRSQLDLASRGKVAGNYGKLPLSFEANQGQADARVKFLLHSSGYTLFLTSDEAVFSSRSDKAKDVTSRAGRLLRPGPAGPVTKSALRMKLVNANPAAKVTGADPLPGRSNYFIGNDPKKWHSNVPTYAKVKYERIYSGVDLVYYGNQGQLEYDFVVSPGADPRRIQFDVRGAKHISRDRHGNLVLQTAAGEVRWRKPTVYQETSGARRVIAAHYDIKHKNRVGFEIADYDLQSPLFIDPLVYSTYLGGSDLDVGGGIAVDRSGNAYVTGYTFSTDFPTVNPVQPENGGGGYSDAFVAKLNPSGSALVYSTYLGGNNYDQGVGIAVDASGNAYVTGYTISTDFPTMNPVQPTYAGGQSDAFVAKLNASGSALVYSTYLGGSGDDDGLGIAVDSSGNAYITGQTSSDDFPTKNPLQPTSAGGMGGDAFVTKLNTSGSALVYSTYLGGSDDDGGFGIAVDGLGNAYVTGGTASTDFPTKNPLQPANAGDNGLPIPAWDAFVAKLNASGSALVYSTYLGGSGDDQGFGIAVDGLGNAYLTGHTKSTNFPTMNPLQASNGGNYDAFVAKLNPSGSALVYSTYLGGSGLDQGFGIAVDGLGDAYVTGQTTSADFPTMNPVQAANAGGDYDAFVTKLNASGSALVYSTYLGGSSDDQGFGITTDSSGNAYVAGKTNSTNFPTMNPLQASAGGSYDAFVSEIFLPGFTIQATGLSPTSLSPGASAVSTITVAPVSGFNANTVSLGCNISPVVTLAPTCSFTALAPGAAGSDNSTLTVSTSGPTGLLMSPFNHQGLLFCALLLPAVGLVLTGAGLGRAHFGRRARVYFLVVGVLALSHCGGGNGGSGNGSGGSLGTPAGNYIITLTGTAPGASQEGAPPQIALTVQ